MGLLDWLGLGRTPTPPAPSTPPAPGPPDIEAALARVEQMVVEGKVPAAVSSRVRRVSRTIENTLPRLANLGAGSYDGYSVMATATDYLPEALSAYLRLPRDWADSRPIENGKTSLLLLIDQLDLLGNTMDKMYDAAVRADAEALILHGRFLQEKFGHSSSAPGLTLPPEGA